MARHRERRILGRAAIFSVLLGAFAATRAVKAEDPRTSAPAGAPRPAHVLFDSISVDHPQFSPNGDGKLDSILVIYMVGDTTRVTVAVTPAAAETPRRVLVPNLTQAPNIRHRTTWNGRIDGVVVPDGDYRLRFEGVRVRDGATITNDRIVEVDDTAPVPAILGIEPPIFTPGVHGAPTIVKTRIQVTASRLGDALGVRLERADSVASFRPLAFRLVDPFLGDGTYLATCDSCATPPTRVPDGSYRIRVTASDPAGNTRVADGGLDKDMVGPALHIAHPSPAPEFHLQHADSLTGTASDRHGVAQVDLRIESASDTTMQQVPGSTTGTEPLHLRADLSTALAVEGRYTLTLFGRDGHGVTDSLVHVLVVDRTAPPQPRLSPRPAPTWKEQQISLEVAVDSTATAKLVRSGGALPPDTLTVRKPIVPVVVVLAPGANHLRFQGIDLAGNVSAADTVTVRWETAVGPSIPERFHPGNSFQIAAGDQPGQGVEVRIYATDGTLVQRFESTERLLVYTFTWDLENPSGQQVHNGAYLVQVLLHTGDGRTERWRKLIAVIE